MCNYLGKIVDNAGKLVIVEENGGSQGFVSGQFDPVEGEKYEFQKVIQSGKEKDKILRILTKKMPA